MFTPKALRRIRLAGCGAILAGAVLVTIATGICPLHLYGLVPWIKSDLGGAIIVLSVIVAALVAFACVLPRLGWRPSRDEVEEKRRIRFLFRRVPQMWAFTLMVHGSAILAFASSFLKGKHLDGHLLLAGAVCFLSGLWVAWIFPLVAKLAERGVSKK